MACETSQPRCEAVTMGSLARDCLDLLPADAVSITLMAADRAQVASATSSRVGDVALDFELNFGEGPGTDAHASGLPVAVADLALVHERWPQYARAAELAGMRAVHAFPLHIGAAKLGVLTLFRVDHHILRDAELTATFAVAESLSEALVSLQSGGRGGALAAALDGGAELRSVVHQATGATAAQLGCSLDVALVRLRGAAFAADRSLTDLAADVVAGRLRMEAS